ncbi:hypothetical protein EB796_012611 [Bugula neritina]|uniref:Uncharacterized protein n=1 Tax=Bugula neritina TaxID=10212 RepID=A0A7J7JTT8_BUGNE|nr:hypothetical protein EB796_012611 [Bugula neritina]
MLIGCYVKKPNSCDSRCDYELILLPQEKLEKLRHLVELYLYVYTTATACIHNSYYMYTLQLLHVYTTVITCIHYSHYMYTLQCYIIHYSYYMYTLQLHTTATHYSYYMYTLQCYMYILPCYMYILQYYISFVCLNEYKVKPWSQD